MTNTSKNNMHDEDGPSTVAGVFTRPTGLVHKIYLSGSLRGPEEYIEWFETIRSAQENDVIVIHINCMGGDSFTAIQFMRVLMETRAMTVASVEGACMSAATFIFLAAKQQEITDNSIFLFHNYSGGAFGKGGEIHKNVSHQRQWSINLLNTIYRDFLSPEEITEILDDRDMWLTSEEVVTRLQERNRKTMERMQAETAIPETPEQKLINAIGAKTATVKARKKRTPKTPTLLLE